jgi:MarR family transcriptional regulator, 2-MHQ and catechol-resistance regulon repressor
MPTHYRGAPGEVAALDAYIKLMRAAESLTARLEPSMAAAGLTVGQFGALEALLHLGPLCQRDLGRKLLRSNGNITVVVGNLAQRGLVRRLRQRDDRRFITVSLTDKGRRLINDLFPRHVSKLVREMAALSSREQSELGRLCRRLGRRGRWAENGKETSNGARPGDTLRLARAL